MPDPEADVQISVAAVADGTMVATLAGDFDISSAEKAGQELLIVALTAPVVALDFAAVPFCDAAGLRALLRLRTEAGRHGCRVVICAVSPMMAWLLRLTGLGTAFDWPPGGPRLSLDAPDGSNGGDPAGR